MICQHTVNSKQYNNYSSLVCNIGLIKPDYFTRLKIILLQYMPLTFLFDFQHENSFAPSTSILLTIYVNMFEADEFSNEYISLT